LSLVEEKTTATMFSLAQLSDVPSHFCSSQKSSKIADINFIQT